MNEEMKRAIADLKLAEIYAALRQLEQDFAPSYCEKARYDELAKSVDKARTMNSTLRK